MSSSFFLVMGCNCKRKFDAVARMGDGTYEAKRSGLGKLLFLLTSLCLRIIAFLLFIIMFIPLVCYLGFRYITGHDMIIHIPQIGGKGDNK